MHACSSPSCAVAINDGVCNENTEPDPVYGHQVGTVGAEHGRINTEAKVTNCHVMSSHMGSPCSMWCVLVLVIGALVLADGDVDKYSIYERGRASKMVCSFIAVPF